MSSQGSHTHTHLQQTLVGVVVVQALDRVFQDARNWDQRLEGSPVGHRPGGIIAEQNLGKRLWGGRPGACALLAGGKGIEGVTGQRGWGGTGTGRLGTSR